MSLRDELGWWVVTMYPVCGRVEEFAGSYAVLTDPNDAQGRGDGFHGARIVQYLPNPGSHPITNHQLS